MIADSQPSSGSVSLADVAKHAGVSAATVCRVLRQSATVRPETVKQVHAAMEAIHFVPAPPRKSRKNHRSGSASDGDSSNLLTRRIALVTVGGDQKFTLLATAIASFVAARTSAARQINVDVVLDAMPDPWKISDLLASGEVGGAILVVDSEVARNPDSVQALRKLASTLPVVWAMGAHAGPLVIDHVAPDNIGIGHMACSYLRGLGCKRLAFVSGTPSWPLVRSRAFGFATATRDANLELTTYLICDNRAEAETYCGRTILVPTLTKLEELLASSKADERPDGIFTPTDREMAQVQPALSLARISPSRDVRLVSCNNDHGYLSMMTARPATFDLHTEAVARQALRRLRNRIHHRNEAPVLIEIPAVLLIP